MNETVPSIRQRLSRTLVIVSVVWGLAVATAVSLAIEHEVDEILDQALIEASQILMPLLNTHGHQLPASDGGVLPASPHKEEVVWQVVDVTHGVILRSHAAPAQPMVAVEQRNISTAANGWRVLVTEFEGPQQ